MKKWLLLVVVLGFVVLGGYAEPVDSSVDNIGIKYSRGDNISTVKNKNPGVTFRDVEDLLGYQYKTTQGQYLTTTETQLTFDWKGRLFSIVMTKKGAALDIYNPLVEKYTSLYGNPKEFSPLTTNLNRNISAATCSFENSDGSVVLLLIIPLDNVNIPYIMVIESYKYDD